MLAQAHAAGQCSWMAAAELEALLENAPRRTSKAAQMAADWQIADEGLPSPCWPLTVRLFLYVDRKLEQAMCRAALSGNCCRPAM